VYSFSPLRIHNIQIRNDVYCIIVVYMTVSNLQLK